MDKLPTLDNLKSLPKIELHAHLNGCARLDHLKDLVKDPSELLCPPREGASSQEYFEFMGAVSRITSTPHNLSVVVTRVLEDFEEDGVVYLELRSGPKKSEKMSKIEYIETILSCIKDYQGKMIVRYLVSIDQGKPLSDMSENAELAIAYTHSSPFVVGVDLCGNFYTTNKENSLNVLKRCKEAGLKITCHIAEDEAISDHTSDLLRDIRPDRLGHATLISPYSEDGEFVRDNNMMIECCMTSNVLSKSVKSYSEHHFKTWYDLQHPVVLCTDDSGTFRTTLSQEYQLALQSFDLSIDDLRKMNLYAIDWVFDDMVKHELRGVFKS